MLFGILNKIENIIVDNSDDYRFFNDHEANIVVSIATSKSSFDEILYKIKNLLPLGTSCEWRYEDNEFEITFIEDKTVEVIE